MSGRRGQSIRKRTGSYVGTRGRVLSGLRECLEFGAVTLRDLERYMGIVGAEVAMPLGEPWRVGKRPYGRLALSTAAACLKGFYLHQAALGVNGDLGGKLGRRRLPARADRSPSFLGHVKTEMPANPLAPWGPHRRHPTMLPDGARERLLATVNSARDAVTRSLVLLLRLRAVTC